MALLEYTVGVAGDYPSWKEAWDFLLTLGPLVNDYEFRQISDCTINNNWVGSRIDLNGAHSVKFYVNFEDSHQGDPTKGFITYVNGADGQIEMVCEKGTLAANIVLDGLYIRQTGAVHTTLVFVRTWSALDPITTTVKNMLIRGTAPTGSTGIKFGNNTEHINASNMKIWNLQNAFGAAFNSITGVDMTGHHIAENITAMTSNPAGSLGFQFIALPQAPLGTEWTLKNCVAIGGNGATAYDWNPIDVSVPNRIQCINCAGSDGSLTASGGIDRTDIQDNIIAADEFASLVETDADFLFLKHGSLAVAFTRDPNGTLFVNQKCKFDPEVSLTPGALRLGETGIIPTLEFTDIAGNDRPGADGFYSIGAHEQQYG